MSTSARCLLVWGLISIAGCKDSGGVLSSALSGSQDALVVVSVTPERRVVPGGTLAVTVQARNAGTTTWRPSSTALGYIGDAAWSGGTLALAQTTRPGAIGTFSGSLGAAACAAATGCTH